MPDEDDHELHGLVDDLRDELLGQFVKALVLIDVEFGRLVTVGEGLRG
jgi:hypothetical protein